MALRDPGVRDKLVRAANEAEFARGVGAEMRRPDYEWIFLMWRTWPGSAAWMLWPR